MRIFSINSKFYKTMNTFWDVVKLNLMWFLFCLPIITIGPATIAAYKVTLKMVNDHEGEVIKQFVEAFKENLKQGIPMGIIMILSTYFIYINVELFNHVENNPIGFLFAAIFIGFVLLTHFTYAFPLMARYDNTIYTTFRNSATISIRYFGRTVLLWMLISLLFILFLFNSTLVYFGFLIGPTSIFLTVSAMSLSIFKKIEEN